MDKRNPSILKGDKAYGSFGWIIPAGPVITEDDIMYAGGGREVMRAEDVQYEHTSPEQLPTGQKMSSTRMEAAAILSLHIAIDKLDPECKIKVRNGIDSKSAMQTYNKIVHMQPYEIYNLHNHDIWLAIKAYQHRRIITMYHVRAHMDTYIKNALIADGKKVSDAQVYDMLTPDWRGNYHADAQADIMHRSGHLLQRNELESVHEVVTYHYGNMVSVALPKWLRANTQYANTMRYWKEHQDLTAGIQIEWSCMKSVTKSHRYLWQRVKFMKILWNTFAYSQKRMEWKLLPPSKNKCVYCDKRGETQEHVLHQCTAKELAQMKEALYNKITNILTDALKPKEGKKHPKRIQNRNKTLLEWIPRMVPKLWAGEMNIPEVGMILVDESFADLDKTDFSHTPGEG